MGQSCDVPRYLLLGEARFDQLTNYCYEKKVLENTVANPLAAWLTFKHLSCKFENMGSVMPPSTYPWGNRVEGERDKGVKL